MFTSYQTIYFTKTNNYFHTLIIPYNNEVFSIQQFQKILYHFRYKLTPNFQHLKCLLLFLIKIW
jgi:hypothetical protein